MQQIQLNIPEPCHEDWHQMSPTEQGRFCNACAKQVVDFSAMTDAQVLNYFSNIKNEKVCGRAYPDQLDRMITMPAAPKKRLFWHWNYITMLFLFFSKTNSAKAQGGLKVDTVSRCTVKNDPITFAVGGISINRNRVIYGKVKDEEGDAVPFASIILKGSKKELSADANGEFSLRINANNDILLISATGYISKEFTLNGLSTYSFILKKTKGTQNEIVIPVAGAISYDDYSGPADPKHIAVLEVKDNATMQPVNKATVVIERMNYHDIDSATTDKKGLYKLKKIREYETYTVKVKADGYIDQQLQIKGSDLDQRKITKQIFLEKAPVVSDYKKMEEVVIKSDITRRMGGMMGGMMYSVRITYIDTLKLITTKIMGDLKIYPNPVQNGNSINVALKLKQTGVYNIQVINAAGLIVLQKQSTATAKQYVEQVQTGKAWSSGIYYVRIFDSSNKMISTSNFLIQ